jgi:hypothetical protein
MGYGNSVTHFLFLNNQFPTATIKIRVKTLKPCQIKQTGHQEVELGLFGRPYPFGGIFMLNFRLVAGSPATPPDFSPYLPYQCPWAAFSELKIIDLR